MQPERLLVTGGAGFIGANFVHYWMHRYPRHRVVVLDALTYAGNRVNLDAVHDRDTFRFVHGDIRDEALVEELLRKEDIDTLVHFAAESHVDRSILGPDPFLQTNVIGTHALLKVAKKVWLDGATAPGRFHHVSTDEVYGTLEPDDPPFTEDTPYRPNSPYAASKAASDHLVRAYHQTFGLDVTISNCSNNYGPFHFPEKLIPLVIINVLEGRELPVYGEGRNIRDWLHVEDHCRGIDAILHHGVAGTTYNIGGNAELANIDVVQRICRVIDARFGAVDALAERFPRAPAARAGRAEELIRFVRDRPGHDFRYAIDARRISDRLGFRPVLSFDDGLARTIAWYLDNEQWWRGVMGVDYDAWVKRQYGGAGPAG